MLMALFKLGPISLYVQYYLKKDRRSETLEKFWFRIKSNIPHTSLYFTINDNDHNQLADLSTPTILHIF